jgi:hypothetical protein
MKVIFLTLLSGLLCAQPAVQTALFRNDQYGSMYAVTTDAAGSIFAAGQASGRGAYLVKMTPGFQIVFIADLQADIATVANSIAVDTAGDVYITGSAKSSILPPTPDAIQPLNAGCPDSEVYRTCSSDAFLVKVDGSNGKVLYATYLGGRYDDAGTAVAIGPDGSVYIAGTTNSPDFPTTAGAIVPALPGSPAGFLARISADGKSMLASTYWNGAPRALAIDVAGAVYITGQTLELNPGTADAFQPSTKPVNLMFSRDDGSHWANLSVPSRVLWVEPDLTNTGIVYAATMKGVLKSADGGITWATLAGPLAEAIVYQVRVDPANGRTLYAIAETDSYVSASVSSVGSALWKSVDAGNTWTRLTPVNGRRLNINQTHPSTLYLGPGTVSYDGGLTWPGSPLPTIRPSRSIAVDAIAGDVVYLGSSQGLLLYRSADSGAHWNSFIQDSAPIALLGSDPVFASGTTLFYQSAAFQTLVGGRYANGLRRSRNGGVSWSTVSGIPVTAGFSDPSRPQSLYITSPVGLFFSPDLGDTWVSFRPNMDNPNVSQVAVAADGALYAVAAPQPTGFVASVDSEISQLSFFTCYGGTGGVTPTAIAIDGTGRIVIAGGTSSRDLPATVGQTVPEYDNGFIARFSADGAQLDFATLLGGGNGDAISVLALFPEGRIVVVGGTGSTDFPTTSNAGQPTLKSSLGNGFVTILDTDGALLYSSYLGGKYRDGFNGIAISGNYLYVAGLVGSADFPGLSESLPATNGIAALVQLDLSSMTLGALTAAPSRNARKNWSRSETAIPGHRE